MFIDAWQGLRPSDLIGPPHGRPPVYPFNVPDGASFYLARNGIYHLIRALGWGADDVVLAPDYHSGVEIWAIRAAGVRVRYYHVDRQGQPDLDELRRLTDGRTRALYVIHHLGWPQPIEALSRFCREQGLRLIEDCALALLSRRGRRPLGSYGDFAVFCLYKTLPVPNGGLIVQNEGPRLSLRQLPLQPASGLSVAARTAELMVSSVHARAEIAGRALTALKLAGGRSLTRLGLGRLTVGDMLPASADPDFGRDRLHVAMSGISNAILRRLDLDKVVNRRRSNYLRLSERLVGRLPLMYVSLPDGACPLSCPVLVPDRPAVARALRQRGIGAIEMWDAGYPEAQPHEGAASRDLRRHLMELPVHQDVTPAGIDFIADQVLRLGEGRIRPRARQEAGATAPPRVALVAASEDILGGQAVAAVRLRQGLERSGVPVAFVPINPQLVRGLGWTRRVRYLRTIVNQAAYSRGLLRLRHADVVHVFSAAYASFLLAPLPAMLAARLFGKRVVLHYHSGEADDHLRRWGRLVHPWLRLPHAIVVPSQYLREVFAAHGYRVRVIANTVDPSGLRYRVRWPIGPHLLSARNLERLYGVDVILRAFALLKRQIPDATLTVAGYGRDEARLRELAAGLQVSGVRFVGRVEPEAMARLYDEADLFVNASTIDNQPLSILEAFAAGLPVVSTPTGDIPNLVRHGETGWLVRGPNPAAFADVILELLANPAAAAAAASRARSELSRFTWPAVESSWLDVYQTPSPRPGRASVPAAAGRQS